MAGLVPAIHAPAAIPLLARHSAFFRILLGSIDPLTAVYLD
jgi:hypothetical protein